MPEIKIISDSEAKKASGKTSSTAKKKTSSQSRTGRTSAQLKLTAAEKKLVQNYRKCNALEKELIQALTEKASGKLLDSKALSTSAITDLITNLLKD